MEIIDNELVNVTNNDIDENGYFEIPKQVVAIRPNCFTKTTKLKKLYIHDNIIRIDEHAFEGSKIKEINIPKSSLQSIRYYELRRLKTLNIYSNISNESLMGNGVIYSKYIDNLNIIYPDCTQTIKLPTYETISKKDNRFLIHGIRCRDGLFNNILVTPKKIIFIDQKFLTNLTGINNVSSIKEQYSSIIRDNFDIFVDWNEVIESIPRFKNNKLPDEYVLLSIPSCKKSITEYFLKEKAYKKLLDEYTLNVNRRAIIKLFYILGFFSGKQEDNEFFLKTYKKIIDSKYIHTILCLIHDIDTYKYGYNPNFKYWFNQNYEKIAKEYRHSSSYNNLPDIYRLYNDIMKKCPNASYKKICEYAHDNAYNVKKGNEELYEEFNRYRKEYDSRDFDVMQDLYEKAKKISSINSKKIITTIDNSKGYSYKWLETVDPVNFFLGNKAGCCARINRVGEGILRASLLNPEVRNLAFLNTRGKIIGKATAYYNVNGKYILFNNAEVSNESKLVNQKAILNTLKRAVYDQVEALNKDDILIEEVAMGMRNNDLNETIINDGIRIRHMTLLENTTFEGMVENTPIYYEGDANDSMEGQCILWEINKQYKKEWLKRQGFNVKKG